MFSTFYCLRDVCFIMSKNLINVNFLLTVTAFEKSGQPVELSCPVDVF